MKETFYRFFWQGWGGVRSKAQDSEHDCPCCGLNLPWPQSAHMNPDKVTPVEKSEGTTVYRIEGTRICPRCSHEWFAVITTDAVESNVVGAFCDLSNVEERVSSGIALPSPVA